MAPNTEETDDCQLYMRLKPQKTEIQHEECHILEEKCPKMQYKNSCQHMNYKMCNMCNDD